MLSKEDVSVLWAMAHLTGEKVTMPMVGDRIQYLGDGNNGTTGGVMYFGTLTRVNDPGGWGPCDVTVNVAGTVTLILSVNQDPMLSDDTGNVQVQPNGSWRMVV